MKMKKVLAALLSAAMVLGTMCFTAFAATTTTYTVKSLTEITDAIEKAAAGDVIQLAEDTEVSDQIIFNKSITLDLNGHTLRTTYSLDGKSGEARYAIVFKNGGKITDSKTKTGLLTASAARAVFSINAPLVVENAKIQGEITVPSLSPVIGTTAGVGIKNSEIKGLFEGSYTVSSFGDNETYYIENSTITGTNHAVYHNGTNKNFHMTAKNSTMTADYVAVYISSKNKKDIPDVDPQKVVLDNCTVKGETAVEVKYTELTLNNCKLTATATKPDYIQNNNGATAKGFAAVITDNAKSTDTVSLDGKIVINGGTYTGIIGLENYTNSGLSADTKTDVKISSGTFSTDVSTYCAKGSTASEDGKTISKTAVASIDNTNYATLTEAFEAAKPGDTVTLNTNLTESIKYTDNKAITLDLNGYTLTNEVGKNTIENHGNLTVTDSSAKTGKVDNISHGCAPFVNYEGGVATLSGGEFDRSWENGKAGVAALNGGNSYYTLKNWGEMTINDGVVVNNNSGSNGSSAVGNGYQNGGKADNHSGVTAANVKLKLTIKGGKFTGGYNTIKNDDYGILEISGGTFENTAQYCIMNWNVATISGGDFTGTASAVIYNIYGDSKMDKGSLEITGGTFNGNIVVTTYEQAGSTGSPYTSFTGGSFTDNNAENYCADGYGATYDKATGTYTVAQTATWTPDTDSGSYMVEDTKYGVIRFMFSADKVNGTIEKVGIKYSNAADIAENVTSVNATADGNISKFQGDVVRIDANFQNNIYAKAFIKTSEKTYWSDSVSCTVDWTKEVAYEDGITGGNE